MRLNPASYAEKVWKNMSNIVSNNDSHYFCMPFNSKISLPHGRIAFEECIEILKNKPPMNSLSMIDKLKLPFPDKNPQLANNRDYITKSLIEIAKENKDQCLINWFHYDNNIKNAEISTVLQLVDDNNSRGERRKHLLDENVKYVGINCGPIRRNIYCIYLVFGS
jgi:hypothetical protein